MHGALEAAWLVGLDLLAFLLAALLVGFGPGGRLLVPNAADAAASTMSNVSQVE
jgi:hypothetical protein